MKRLLSMLLAICMVASFFMGVIPQAALAADNSVITDAATFKKRLEDEAQTVFTLSGTLWFDETITIQSGRSITIQAADDNRAFIRPSSSAWPIGTPLLKIADGANVVIKDITIGGAYESIENPKKLAQGITVEGSAKVVLDSISIQNCNGGTGSGAGLYISGAPSDQPGSLTIQGHSVFWNNTTNTSVPNGGGGIYVGKHYNVYMDNVEFMGNQAHSGGAMYVYNSFVLAKNCEFGLKASAQKVQNEAGQRGGAIHCHGTMVLQDCTVINNLSGQYGGGIYVSANDAVKGMVLLDNTRVGRNSTTGSGGGVYIASDATLYLKGSNSVSGNYILTSIEDWGSTSDTWDNNIFYNTTYSRIVLLDKVVGEIGISTSNPTDGKLAAYTVGNVGGLSELRGRIDKDIYSLDDVDETLNEFTDEMKKCISYDSSSGIWHLVGLQDDPKAGEKNPESYQKGRLWLKLGIPGVDPNGNQPYVIFDYNLHGTAATVYPHASTIAEIKVGDPIPAPPRIDTSISGADFHFLRWSDQPTGGRTFNPGDNVTVKEGVQIYYAQWEITIPDTVIPADLFTVYFDYNYPGGGVTSALVGTMDFTAEISVSASSSSESGSISATGKKTVLQTVKIAFKAPLPARPGYTFTGWANSPNATSGSITPAAPTATTTYYATWRASTYTLKWDANGGTGGCITQQNHDTTVSPPATQPTKPGYNFECWYLDKNCTIPLTSGTLVTGAATFYAGWTPKEYTITWDAGYTGGSVTTVTQYHDQTLKMPAEPVRHGYEFINWVERNDHSTASASIIVDGSKTYVAQWSRETTNYQVTVEWRDFNDNDAVRPEFISVTLMQNGVPMQGSQYTKRITAENAEAENPNKWVYDFKNLPQTDVVSNPITYSVAITSSVPDEYVYRVENRAETAGYILLTHSLITRDVDAYVAWDDNSNQDGIRPATVTLQLYANDIAMTDSEYRVALSGSGDTWFYRFHDVQKYYIDATGNKGQEIVYTIRATATNPDELKGYVDDYHNYTAILSHETATVERTVHVEWQDNNDQDGKRPASVMVQLYGDNVPLEGKVVLLSDANNWAYTWGDLPKYTDGGREVTYSARVSSTLVDYTAKSTGMSIEMTYVPSSTSISAFVTWTDVNDADGLRPDFVTAQLIADGQPTGDSQVLSAASGWTVNWTGYPVYKDGDRIEYTFEVDVPDGYSASYHGVYDTSGLSAVLTHTRITQTLVGNIVWEDRENQSGGRMSQVSVLLCADGSVIDDTQRVTITANDGWEHAFHALPKYRDHGEEIRYSIILASDPGKYEATTSHMTITMRLEPEYVDVPFQIIWDDNNNSDGTRPDYVAVTLLVDGQPSQYGQTATAQANWAVTFSNLDKYGSNGLYRYTAQLAAVPDGYTATYTSPGVVALKRAAQTKDVTATVIWQDNDDQYGQRPERVTLALYADYLDGNGPQHTGRVERCEASQDWSFTFTGVPALNGGKNILYSVVASGNLPNYTISYDGLEVYMRHASYDPAVTVDYTANVVWHDGHNAKGSRPYNLLVTLYANGEAYQSQTLTERELDGTGYTWRYTFRRLPTKMDGVDVAYTIGITEPVHYTAVTEGNTITLTHVMDVPILLRWDDQRDNDGFRPASLTLELYGDTVKTDTAITMTGDHNAETWRDSFRQIPVWSVREMDHEIVYTWAFAGHTLGDKGYTANYNGFTATTVDNESLYPIDLTRPGDVADVPVGIVWDDDTDRDGLRPGSLAVELYADGRATGKRMTLTGSDEARSWTGSFSALPVWKDGVLIQYSIRAGDLNGYTAQTVVGDPLSVTLSHAPATEEITATAVWDDSSSVGGLTRFDIAVELMVDGNGSGSIGVLDAENNYRESWGQKFVHHDHGEIYRYTVQVTEPTRIPEDYDVTVENRAVTVKRERFHINGGVQRHIGTSPAVGATVTLCASDRETVIETVTTDGGGLFHFTVTNGNYYIKAELHDGSYYFYGAELSIDRADRRITLRLMQTYSISGLVSDNRSKPLSGAQVVVRQGQQIIGTVTTDAKGNYAIGQLPGGVYEIQAYYSHNNKVYLSESRPGKPMGFNDFVDLTIVLPDESTPCSTASGRVLEKSGKGVPGILVRCRNDMVFPNTLVVEATTDSAGQFTLEGLPAGNYRLTFIDQDGNELKVTQTAEFTVPNAATPISLGDITLAGGTVLPTTPSGTLTGIALDKEGKPVQGAQVIVTDKSTDDLVNILTTDPNGSFEAKLPTGEYSVELWRPFDNNTNHLIRVDDETASEADSPISADSFTISGEVLDEDGAPMEGVTVYLYGEDGRLIQVSAMPALEDINAEPEPSRDETIAEALVAGAAAAAREAMLFELGDTLPELEEADALPDESEDTAGEADPAPLADDGFIRMDEMVTAQDGKYLFAGLPAGRYVVKIARGIGSNGGSTDIPVTAAPIPEIPEDAKLSVTTDSYTVSGVVVGTDGAPVHGATVTLLDDENQQVASLTTGEDGSYEFANLPEGAYTVNISYPDSELLSKGDVSVMNGGFTAFPGQSVTGTVKDNKGNPLSHVTITFQGEGGIYTAVTDQNGIYHVALADGKYTMAASYQGKTAEKSVTVKGQSLKADLTITLSDGGTTTPGGNTPGGNTPGGSGSGSIGGGPIGGGEDIPNEPKTFVLSGVICDKDGKGVEGASVTAVDAKSGETYTATTGPDGSYALALPKGTYTVTVSYGSTTSNPKRVTVSKDVKLESTAVDNLGRAVLAYVTGYKDGTFGGTRNITRCEVVALVSRVSTGFDKDKTYRFDFKDVAKGVWYANNLGYCVEAGLVQGRGNGHFDPTANITRAEFAAIVARFLGLPNKSIPGESTYTDTEGNWAEGYISQLTAKGIVEGKGDGNFDPTANISRYEAVTMLNRALDRTPDKAVLDGLLNSSVIRAFPDLTPGHWAYYQVLEAALDHYHK